MSLPRSNDCLSTGAMNLLADACHTDDAAAAAAGDDDDDRSYEDGG